MIPAALVSSAASGVAVVAAFLGWFVAVVHGRTPDGLQAAMAYSLGYSAQAVRVRVRTYGPLSPLEPAGGLRAA